MCAGVAQGTQGWGALDTGGAWALLGRSAAQAAWHAGFLALPAALFAVGASRQDLLHAAYLALLVAQLAAPCAALEPAAMSALVPAVQVGF